MKSNTFPLVGEELLSNSGDLAMLGDVGRLKLQDIGDLGEDVGELSSKFLLDNFILNMKTKTMKHYLLLIISLCHNNKIIL